LLDVLDPSLVTYVRKSLPSIWMLETLQVIWLRAGKHVAVFANPMVAVVHNNLTLSVVHHNRSR